MVKIISDSTCDLSQEVLKKYDIDIMGNGDNHVVSMEPEEVE